MIIKLKQLALSFFVLLGITSNATAHDPDNIWDRVTNGALLIDVRTEQEYNKGHLEGAIHIPYELVVERLAIKGLEPDTDIIVYCKSGRRSEVAKSMLEQAGYSNVMNAGGYQQLLEDRPE